MSTKNVILMSIGMLVLCVSLMFYSSAALAQADSSFTYQGCLVKDGQAVIGPMAQDFYAAFRVGEDEKRISSVDADGVALAAIQGLHQVVQEQDARIAALETELSLMQSKQIVRSGSSRSWSNVGIFLGLVVIGLLWSGRNCRSGGTIS